MILKKLPPIETVEDESDYAVRLVQCSKSCSYFAEQFMNLEVFDYNKVFLDCEDRFIVYRTGRQVGKSRNAAIKAVHFGYFAPLKASNLEEGECNVVIASLSKDQAYLIFRKIKNFVNKSPTLKKAVIHSNKTEMSIEWFNGEGQTNFIVRPIGDTGESLRGFTAHFAILDEAAYIPQAVYDAFLPSTVTTKPKILLTSTPKGKAGQFFKSCQESHTIYRKGLPSPIEGHENKEKYQWTQFHVTTYDNPLAASDPQILKLIAGTTEAGRQQELMGEFIDGGNSFIPYNLLQEALIPIDRPMFEYYECGIDTSGKGNDETVLIIVGITEDKRIVPIEVYTELTTEQPKLARKINHFDQIYRFRRIYLDETGMGDTLMDCCKEVNPQLPLFGINFKAEKTELYLNLARLFDDKVIHMSLLEEIHLDKLSTQISYMYWEHGKFKDQKEKVRSEYPDDYPDAFALSCYGQQKGEFIQEVSEEIWDN